MILAQLYRLNTVGNFTTLSSPGLMSSARFLGVDGYHELFWSAAGWTLMWLALFYVFCVSFPHWSKMVEPSSKEHENDRYWSSRELFGLVHAMIISALSLPPLFLFLFDSDERVKFASSPHLATCKVDRRDVDLLDWELTMQAISLAGLAFTTFTLADLVVLSLHGMATLDYIVHHVAFVSAGLILRGNCMLPFNAAVLMAMEVSTPFLNWVTFFRHRGEQYENQVIGAGVMFFLTFLVFRLGLNIYGTVLLVLDQARGLAMPERVPMWQQVLVILAIIAGVVVQGRQNALTRTSCTYFSTGCRGYGKSLE
mmetsp:Transcript_72372/g.114741  ORF Transcript_72372/g.114741 Transcript_72372/m.114741 type:complete len:311 (-) Transcript_72372:108-1040(-)